LKNRSRKEKNRKMTEIFENKKKRVPWWWWPKQTVDI